MAKTVKISLLTQIAVDILSEFSILGTLVQMQRKFPYFKIHSTTTELPSNLQLKVSNAPGNAITWYQGKNSKSFTNAFQVMHVLSIICFWIGISIRQYLSVLKDIYVKVKCVKSQQITIDR